MIVRIVKIRIAVRGTSLCPDFCERRLAIYSISPRTSAPPLLHVSVKVCLRTVHLLPIRQRHVEC